MQGYPVGLLDPFDPFEQQRGGRRGLVTDGDRVRDGVAAPGQMLIVVGVQLEQRLTALDRVEPA